MNFHFLVNVNENSFKFFRSARRGVVHIGFPLASTFRMKNQCFNLFCLGILMEYVKLVKLVIS